MTFFYSVEIEVYLESLEIFLATTASIGVMAGIIMIMITFDDDNFPRDRGVAPRGARGGHGTPRFWQTTRRERSCPSN